MPERSERTGPDWADTFPVRWYSDQILEDFMRDFMQDERPPQRPGSRAPGPAPRPPADDPAADRAGPRDPAGLAERIQAAVDRVERVWEDVDPRTGKLDAFQEAVGDAAEARAALGEFFGHATLLLGTLRVMWGMLDEADGAAGRAAGTVWDAPANSTPLADLAAFRKASGAYGAPYDGVVTRPEVFVDLLSRAGVEVDEADVLSWTEAQWGEAFAWCSDELAKRERDAGVNPTPRPDFLPPES